MLHNALVAQVNGAKYQGRHGWSFGPLIFFAVCDSSGESKKAGFSLVVEAGRIGRGCWRKSKQRI
jgi:hypothetical protein